MQNVYFVSLLNLSVLQWSLVGYFLSSMKQIDWTLIIMKMFFSFVPLESLDYFLPLSDLLMEQKIRLCLKKKKRGSDESWSIWEWIAYFAMDTTKSSQLLANHWDIWLPSSCTLTMASKHSAVRSVSKWPTYSRIFFLNRTKNGSIEPEPEMSRG